MYVREHKQSPLLVIVKGGSALSIMAILTFGASHYWRESFV